MLTTVTCESLLAQDHPFRKLDALLKLGPLCKTFAHLYSKKGAPSLPIEQGLRMLLIQFWKDFSDRQMEHALAENIAVKWYCNFELGEPTPDHSYFHKLRKRYGTHNIAKLFTTVKNQLQKRGMVSEVFQFVDATAIETKKALWDERDRAIARGEEKLNNTNVRKYSADSQARFGCRGKNKFFFGYKRHVNVDMGSGMIVKVAGTPGNVPDGQAVHDVLGNQGMVFADKAYCTQAAQQAMQAHGCHSGAIKKRNMVGKDNRHDHWLTRVRMPYEGVFSKLPKRARYRGWAKVQMQVFMEAVVYNLKRALRIEELQAGLSSG